MQQNRTSCCDRPAGKSSALAPTLLAHAAGREDPAAVHRAAAVSLVLLTTLSPCVGSMPVLISLLAPPVAASTVVAAAGTLLLTSVFVMCSLVAVSYLGAATMDFGRIRRHERLILGLGLVVLAGLTFFVFSDEHKHHHHGEHMMNGNDGEHGMHSHAEHMRMEGGRSEGGALGSGTTGEGQHLEGHMDGEGMLRMLRMPAWMQEWLRPIRRH